MQSETQLILTRLDVSPIVTANESLSFNIAAGDYFFVTPSPVSYTVGSKIDFVDASSGVPPYPVVQTRYVQSVELLTGNIYVNEPFDINMTVGSAIDIDIYGAVATEFYCDLYENESISQNFIFQDVGTFAPLGDFSREFRVPASDRNLEIFGLLDSFTFSDTSNVYGTKIPAEIRVDTLPIIRGHVRVIKTFKKNDLLADLQLSFYGQSPDLFRAIGDKLLNQIEYLTTLNRVIDYQEINDSFGAGNELTWGLVDRGQRWDNTGTQNSRPIFNSENPIYAGDFTPFLNAWTIFSKIIEEAGFTMTPTPLQTILEGYYCPWLLTKNLVTEETVADYYFNAGYTAATTSLVDDSFFVFPELVDNGNNYLSGFFYAPVEGFYAFRFWANVQPIGAFGANVGGVKFYRFPVGSPNGTIVVNYEVAVSGTDQNNNVVQRVLFTTIPVYMQAGERIAPYTEFNGTPNFYGDANNNPLSGTGWELYSYFRNWGDTLDVAGNSPNIKQVDFVKDILAMHAAVIVPSRTVPKQVTIIPIVDYIGTGDDLDWTNKLDISKDIVLSPTTDIQKRNFIFTYKAGGDFMSKLYTENGRTYGEYKILNGYTVNANTPANEFVTGDSNVKLTAESTPATYINGTNIPIPKFINDKGEFLTPNLRFLFLADYTTLPVYRDNNNTVQDTNVQIFNHYSSVNASVIDYDLNFNPETPLHSIITNPFRNLFNEYWRDYLNGLYNPETRILEAYFALDLADILSFSYADRIFIKDSYWRIIEISDYKIGLYESVKVKLIKLVNPSPDCDLVPVNAIIDDNKNQIIEFEDYSGNPQPANPTCCARYGYTWDTIQNRCMSFGGVIVTNPGGGGSSASTMFGAGKDGQPINVLAKTTNTEISPDNSFSVYAGNEIKSVEGNRNMLAVGDRLELADSTRGAVMLGKSVYTNQPGLHLGGGFVTDNRANTDGANQWGVIMLSAKDALTVAGDRLYLYTEGIPNKWISMPDDTSWNVLGNLNIYNPATDEYYAALFNVYIEKLAGVTYASAITVINSINTFATITFTLNVSTAVAGQHRFNVISGGTGFPVAGVQASCSLNYQQFRK
jgi:hypothetical protein